MQLFFVPQIGNEDIITLDKEESSHISKVLRMKEGEEIFLTDGRGNLFTCKLLEANPKKCSAEIIKKEENYQKSNYKIHLAIAPTKNMNRMEWLLEKIVEEGIDEITPIVTEHSERRNINTERLNKIIISAMKQSVKCFKPKLNELTEYPSFIGNLKEEKKYLCCCSEGEKIYIKDDYLKGQNAVILIGPEGDFSSEEVIQAQNAGCRLITLGQQRLRTETAALYAVSNIHFLNQ
ncbi:MAG: 16S rRNA (uracil(1498)-N(3))-methyltransferase [Bacteroidales bacterium]|nr:16S rRNA (uracil(1498)-N(3))-methyltransferase [Bacteroidales bacterium]